MELNFQSQACQDRFVGKILDFKRGGYYIDIGSCHAISTNNTFALESLGWKGVCIEIDEKHSDSYKQRTCHYIKDDALKVNYSLLLETVNAPKRIDYLSLDVDHISTDVLKLIPFHEYSFNIITIEHDAYLHGDKYRDAQREILFDKGYVLFAADVLVPLQHDTKENSPFEDWYLHPSLLEKWSTPMSGGLYPNQIIEALKQIRT